MLRRPAAHLSVLFLALLAATFAFVVFPPIPYAIEAPLAGLILSTATVVLAAAAASRAWIRYEEATEDDGLFQASAFLVLLVGGSLRLAVVGSGRAAEFGYDATAPGQAPLLLWTVATGTASVLLLIAALAALRRWRRPRPHIARVWLFGPALSTLILGALVLVSAPTLPAFVPTQRLAYLIEPGSAIDPAAVWLPWAVMQLTIGGVFATGAVYFWRVASRSRRPGYPAYLAAGLLAAAFMELYLAFVPGPYAQIVTGADVMRLLFYLLVLAGVGVATRADLVELAAANRDLERLRDAERWRVVADERARLAREVHDGLVQEIWLARLTGGQLTELPDLPAEAHPIVARIDGILEAALAEARDVVLTLQPDSTADFADLLAKFMADYAERHGLEIDFKVDGRLPRLAPEVQRELLRICREALNNTRKHADATLVRVVLASAGPSLRLALSDNGLGFLPADSNSSGFGLRSMRERAATIGARLEVISAPMDGTKVIVELGIKETA